MRGPGSWIGIRFSEYNMERIRSTQKCICVERNPEIPENVFFFCSLCKTFFGKSYNSLGLSYSPHMAVYMCMTKRERKKERILCIH